MRARKRIGCINTSGHVLVSVQEVVPSYLATSPIPPSSPIQTPGPESSATKRRRKRRRKSKVDSLKRETSGEYSEYETVFAIEMSSHEGDDEHIG